MALAAINVKRAACRARLKILLWVFGKQAENGPTYFLMPTKGISVLMFAVLSLHHHLQALRTNADDDDAFVVGGELNHAVGSLGLRKLGS